MKGESRNSRYFVLHFSSQYAKKCSWVYYSSRTFKESKSRELILVGLMSLDWVFRHLFIFAFAQAAQISESEDDHPSVSIHFNGFSRLRRNHEDIINFSCRLFNPFSRIPSTY